MIDNNNHQVVFSTTLFIDDNTDCIIDIPLLGVTRRFIFRFVDGANRDLEARLEGQVCLLNFTGWKSNSCTDRRHPLPIAQATPPEIRPHFDVVHQYFPGRNLVHFFISLGD
ncbi:hypothetical protein GCN78_11375 [Janthinobacterium rivuli]|uniref:hypothetical protein n=1 Tax=Janthinobacterium sp. FT68W TaxID=2654255 RepID=UPI001264DE3E|nr:hypothetical protein [Janthinobacterium sp. FT68W]KAB8051619.1 hypothetical protein GCN78_11375 [Janthinobacterium sp. FT68W]